MNLILEVGLMFMRLVASFWDEVGIKTAVKPRRKPPWTVRVTAGEHQVARDMLWETSMAIRSSRSISLCLLLPIGLLCMDFGMLPQEKRGRGLLRKCRLIGVI